jgi:hypothetical protein
MGNSPPTHPAIESTLVAAVIAPPASALPADHVASFQGAKESPHSGGFLLHRLVIAAYVACTHACKGTTLLPKKASRCGATKE